MGLFGKAPATPSLDPPTTEVEQERIDRATIFGPAGVVAEFDLQEDWEYTENGSDILGNAPDGKAIHTVGLGGQFFAIVKER